jgi:hypothetical protein
MIIKGIEIDKVFVNKQYKPAFSIGSKVKIWFNNLTFSDYVFLDKMSSDIYSDCGLEGVLKSPQHYKKNLLFVNGGEISQSNNSHTISPSVNLYAGCFISVLEKDRCLFSYDKTYQIMWEEYEQSLVKVIQKEIRKEKISTLLHENKNI